MTEELTGPIIRVERHTDTDTGIVTVQAVRAGRVAHVNVNVSSGRLDEALVWMRARDGRRRKPRQPDKRRADGGQPRRGDTVADSAPDLAELTTCTEPMLTLSPSTRCG